LEESAVRLGMRDRIRFEGWVPRTLIPEYFGAADMLLHGSVVESAGYALLEAMAAGLPVVCTNSGGPSEYVKDGETGFVVPVADQAAMAEKAVLLLQNVELREKLGRQARERVETQFRQERMIRETVATYVRSAAPSA
jgi:glycosyltransferase involved in cell wall biosynthesis